MGGVASILSDQHKPHGGKLKSVSEATVAKGTECLREAVQAKMRSALHSVNENSLSSNATLHDPNIGEMIALSFSC